MWTDRGYLEGLVRGLTAGILTLPDYHNLTDYGSLLTTGNEDLTVKENILNEFRCLHTNSLPPLHHVGVLHEDCRRGQGNKLQCPYYETPKTALQGDRTDS
uniref:Uncharacterized protein n=1 Tax=Oncorhynchus kisutch TaxID=8019 RepID=A0A8C7IDX0_ONCKI